MRQARYWILTIPRDDWNPILPDGVQYIRGQPELGESGYRHWQLVAYFPKKVTLSACKSKFAVTAHAEPCRSAAAKQYVWKEETRDGEQFEFGTPSVERSSVCDWEEILAKAKSGDLEGIPADVVIRYYSSLARIGADFAAPTALERSCIVYYGPTGTGKSRKAWEEAGLDAFPKDPRSKFWFGYKGQKNVVLDEFRGGIDISHLLRWLDRYPCNVELKGSSRVLVATNFWITSNLHPDQWYPDLDEATKLALKRRLVIVHMPCTPFTE